MVACDRQVSTREHALRRLTHAHACTPEEAEATGTHAHPLAAVDAPSPPLQNPGKSTLLDILAGRKSVGRLTGSVMVNGAPRGPTFVRHIS